MELRPRPRHALALASVVMALVAPAAAQTRGVALSKQDLYPRDGSGSFRCLGGSGLAIDASRVNDEFCDCPDGSDEPGTSACADGRFYCRNRGHRGQYIFSSRVNDGVCDCCDGSDEYKKQGCRDTCEDEAMEETRELRDRMATLEAGTRVRAQWAADADSSLKEQRESIDSLRAKVEEARQEAAAAQAKVAEQEEADRRAHEERSVELRVQVAESLRLTSLSAAQLQQVLVDLVVRRRDILPTVRASTELLLGPDPDATVDVGADGSVSDASPPAAEAGHPEDDPDEEAEGAEGLAAEGPKDPVEGMLDDVERDAEPSQALTEARNAARRANQTVDGTQTQVTETEKVLAGDYGPDNVFFALRGQCYSLQAGQYTYEVCPFDKTRQDHVSLGDWAGWGEGGHTLMRFSGGQKCWNGPERSADVYLECGTETKLLSADEPSTCAYRMRMATPAACTEAEMASIKAQLEGGEVEPAE